MPMHVSSLFGSILMDYALSVMSKMTCLSVLLHLVTFLLLHTLTNCSHSEFALDEATDEVVLVKTPPSPPLPSSRRILAAGT